MRDMALSKGVIVAGWFIVIVLLVGRHAESWQPYAVGQWPDRANHWKPDYFFALDAVSGRAECL
jgi:hypothetical protein